MLFPQLGATYYNQGDKEILNRMESFYAESITINQSFWSEADTDTRFEAGDQTLWNDIYGNLSANRKKQFNFNRIRRVVNLVSGHQRKNRKSTIVVGVENSDNKTADQFTKTLMFANRQESVLETVSDSFHGALVTGLNLMQVWMDYRSDPVSGNIKVDNCSYNSFLIDPYFKKADLSDCNAIWKRSFLTKREVISLLPAQAEEIIDISSQNGTGRDGKFQFMPESYNYGIKNLLTYDEYYYRDYRTQKMLIDSQTGETQEWKGHDEEQLALFLKTYPTITVVDQDIPTVKLAIVVEGKVMYDGPNPLGIDQYPFVPVFGYYNPQMSEFTNRIQGMVRGLRDAQYLYNRRKIIELDILESQINSGWIYKENALVNPKDVFLNGQGRGLALKEEAMMSDVQQIQAPQVPPSMIQLSEILGREIQEISGVNEELLGSATDDKAGILSMLRQGAGLTTLQGLFDSLDRSQKLLGKIMIDIIQSNFTPGKIKRIIEEEPTDQFYNKSFGKYDAAIEDGLNTTTQRQMQFAQMLHLKEAGVPISTKDLLEASTLQNKDKIIESAMQQEQQMQQAQQQQEQVQMQEQAARTNLANSRAEADSAMGKERMSRIPENRALAEERRAEAESDRAAADLDRAKTLKELEDLDVAQLEKLIAMSNILRAKDTINSKVEKQEDLQAMQAVQQQATQPQEMQQQAQQQQAISSPMDQLGN
jgi:hypothetical protein